MFVKFYLTTLLGHRPEHVMNIYCGALFGAESALTRTD